MVFLSLYFTCPSWKFRKQAPKLDLSTLKWPQEGKLTMCYHGLTVKLCVRSSGSYAVHALFTNTRMVWHSVTLLIKKKPGGRINDNQEREG